MNLLRQSFKKAKSQFTFDIEEIVILPEHFHMIVNIHHEEDFQQIIHTIKQCFSQNYKYPNLPVWKEAFHAHKIRSEKEYKAKVQYMYDTPVKQALVTKPNEWRHSSFNYLG